MRLPDALSSYLAQYKFSPLRVSEETWGGGGGVWRPGGGRPSLYSKACISGPEKSDNGVGNGGDSDVALVMVVMMLAQEKLLVRVSGGVDKSSDGALLVKVLKCGS